MRDFITRSHDYLYEYGLVISWTVVLTQAKEFATELKYRGIMTQQEYDYFLAIKGWVTGLKKRNNLHIIKPQGELKSMSEATYQEFIIEFRTGIKGLMDEHDVPAST